MLPGLSALEIGRLRMSVGYKGNTKGRPLSPVEVGELLLRTYGLGATPTDCEKDLNLSASNQQRFVRVHELPQDLRHLVQWGKSSDSIGFTSAVELARFDSEEDQREVAAAVLESNLQTDEIRQVGQLRRRSGRSIKDCLQEVIGMRPTVERRYVFIGAVDEPRVREVLAEMTQAERDAVLLSALEAAGVTASGRLGRNLFTLVGDERLNDSLREKGREAVEATLRKNIAMKMSDARSNS